MGRMISGEGRWNKKTVVVPYQMNMTLSPVLHLTEATFETHVMKSERLVLVDFWANWCPPCKILAPILEEIAVEMADLVLIAEVDIEAEPALYQKYGIQSLPTLLFFKDGIVIETMVGAPPKRSLIQKIQILAGDLV